MTDTLVSWPFAKWWHMLHVADAADTASVVAGEGFRGPDVIDACPTLGATDKITPNVRKAKQSIATSGVTELYLFLKRKLRYQQ